MVVSGEPHAPNALPPGIYWIGGWVGPRAGPEAVKREVPSPFRDSPAVLPLAWSLHWLLSMRHAGRNKKEIT
jgi:hypothetical protein